MDWIVELVKEYGVGAGVIVYFLYRFNIQNKLMDKERGELKDRIVVLEKKEEEDTLYIRTELTNLLDGNRKALNQVNKTIEAQSIGFIELQKIIRKATLKKSTD